MNKNEKDLMNQLSDLDDFSVEEIAEKYPALSGNTKKRILKKCKQKDSSYSGIESDGENSISISGTERYDRKLWYKFAATAAAFVVAVVGISSVFIVNRDLNGNEFSEVGKLSIFSFNDSQTNSNSNNTTSSTSDIPYDNSFNDPQSKNFSAITNIKSIPLNETYWTYLDDGGSVTKSIRFADDGVSGEYIISPESATDITNLPFSYEKNENDISFFIESNGKVTATLSDGDWRIILTAEWQDGHTECFWNSDPDLLNYVHGISSGIAGGNVGISETDNNKTTQPTTSEKDASVNNNEVIILDDTHWSEINGTNGNFITFGNDSYSGHYGIPPENYVTANATLVYFTYTQNQNEINFYIGSDTATGYISVNTQKQEILLTLVWANGETNYLTTHDIAIDPDGNLKYLTKDNNYESQYPIANQNLFFLNGTSWYEYEIDGPIENFIVFDSDGVSGHYGIQPESYATADATLIYFTYAQNGNEIFFYIGSEMAIGKLSVDYQRKEILLTLTWPDGNIDYLYCIELYNDDIISIIQN